MRFPGELSPNMKKSNFQHLFLLEGKTTDIFRFNVQISFINHIHGSLEPFLNFFEIKIFLLYDESSDDY